MSKKYINSVLIEDNKVIKKNNGKIEDLYNLFDTVSFNNCPRIIDIDEENVTYEFLEGSKYHELSEGVEFIRTVSMLHYKTLFFKDVSLNKYENIYNMILGNINYLRKYYTDLISDIESSMFMSPSSYLIARNYSIINDSLNISLEFLNKWYKLVKNKTSERVCIIHNNLSLEHFIKNKNNYLISFDNYETDTPILDLYKFYKNEGYKLNFSYLFNVYNENLLLLEEEKLLFYILICMPLKIEKIGNEYLDCINIGKIFKYINTSLKLINSWK